MLLHISKLILQKARTTEEMKSCCVLQAQSNFGQYFPVIMLLLGFLEANEVMSQKYLLTLAAIITALRVGHSLQLSFPQQLPLGFRMAGFMGTVAFFILCGILCILVGLQVSPVRSSLRTLCCPAITCDLHAPESGLFLDSQLLLQEFGVVDQNLLGNNRSWLGFADDKYAQASGKVKSGWNTVKDKAQDL